MARITYCKLGHVLKARRVLECNRPMCVFATIVTNSMDYDLVFCLYLARVSCSQSSFEVECLRLRCILRKSGIAFVLAGCGYVRAAGCGWRIRREAYVLHVRIRFAVAIAR